MIFFSNFPHKLCVFVDLVAIFSKNRSILVRFSVVLRVENYCFGYGCELEIIVLGLVVRSAAGHPRHFTHLVTPPEQVPLHLCRRYTPFTIFTCLRD